ncbi:MAG: 50S ribosomal protein L30 [Pseudobdellovibrionaceae bacterium]|jgi:large subunit ribosomal protein L30|nr:50S ribosomal protein L30 [Pseudomonadota bacterium]
MAKTFVVTLVKSPIGCTQSQRRTIEALGLKKRHHSVTLADNPANRGQVMKIQHLVDVQVQR